MKKKESNKKRNIIIAVSIVIAFILLITARIVFLQVKENTKPLNTIEDCSSIKDVVRFYGCEYKKEKRSEDPSCKLDIYLTFAVDPYTEEGQDNREFYRNISRGIASVLNYDSYRMIDQSRELIIKVKSTDKQVTSISINGNDNYFGTQQSKNTLKKYEPIDITPLQIQSLELSTLLEDKWKYEAARWKVQETIKFEGYDVSLQRGMLIKAIDKKIFNIIFTQNYEDMIVNGLTTKSSLQEVQTVLGKSVFGSIEEELLGYKGEDAYFFFRKWGDIDLSYYGSRKFR